jgi:hypothetical protein
LLFAAVGVGLVLQYAAVGLAGLHYGTEPWPAVVLPGFKTVYDDGTSILVERPTVHVVFDDGAREPVELSRLLAPLPRSHHASFLRAQCRPAALSGTDDTERCRSGAGRRWVLERAAAVAPTRSVRAVVVTWEHLRLDPASGTTVAQPLDSLSLAAPSEAVAGGAPTEGT